MLIRNLYFLFCGSESQNGRSDCAPDVIDKANTQVVIPEKFRDDIERLGNYMDLSLVFVLVRLLGNPSHLR